MGYIIQYNAPCSTLYIHGPSSKSMQFIFLWIFFCLVIIQSIRDGLACSAFILCASDQVTNNTVFHVPYKDGLNEDNVYIIRVVMKQEMNNSTVTSFCDEQVHTSYRVMAMASRTRRITRIRRNEKS